MGGGKKDSKKFDEAIPENFVPAPGFDDEVDGIMSGIDPTVADPVLNIPEENSDPTPEPPAPAPAPAQQATEPSTKVKDTEASTAAPQQVEGFEIIHNGHKLIVPNDQLKDYVQKGYDYDQKVGAHQKLAKLVDADPNLRELINSYFTGQLAEPQAPAGQETHAVPDIEIKPLTEYEDDEEWLKDNLKTAIQTLQQTQQPSASVPQAPAVIPIDQVLMLHDPEHFQEVAPEVLRRAQEELTVAQYQKVNTDQTEFIKFYNKVKNDMLAKQKPQSSAKPVTPTFTAKPSPGAAPQTTQKNSGMKDAFSLSDAEFDKLMNKVKYGSFQ